MLDVSLARSTFILLYKLLGLGEALFRSLAVVKVTSSDVDDDEDEHSQNTNNPSIITVSKLFISKNEIRLYINFVIGARCENKI